MQNLLEDLKELLQQDEKLVVDGKLLKNKIIELALQLDATLIKMLLKNESIKKHFFQDVDKNSSATKPFFLTATHHSKTRLV
jgi:adenine-specific DNA-methyltransferase